MAQRFLSKVAPQTWILPGYGFMGTGAVRADSGRQQAAIAQSDLVEALNQNRKPNRSMKVTFKT
jgi:hypothetical protein